MTAPTAPVIRISDVRDRLRVLAAIRRLEARRTPPITRESLSALRVRVAAAGGTGT